MRRYYHFMTCCAVIVIVISLFSGFSSPEKEDMVATVIKQRTSIMQKAFYNQITKEKAEKQLEKIETYPILTEDIKQLRKWNNTELDIVKKMSFTEIKAEKNLLEYLTYRVSILWEMNGQEKDYFMEGQYHVVMKRVNNEYKLSCFTPV